MAWSQGNQGTLEGTVVDQSGAGVPDAKLTVTNNATGIKFRTSSDSSGLFTIPVLPVGTYTVEVEHAGFGKLTQKDRKSTRLNSSHTVISYAVFCLKKKNHSYGTGDQQRALEAEPAQLVRDGVQHVTTFGLAAQARSRGRERAQVLPGPRQVGERAL